jgi:glucose-6-phosphate 1-dehydrogenase
MTKEKLGPSIITIFGAAGDLSKRKLIPALYNLYLDGALPEELLILCVARRKDHGAYKSMLHEGLESFSRRKPAAEKWHHFASKLHLVEGTFEDPHVYERISKMIADEEKVWGQKSTRVYYLSVPPSFVELIIDQMDKAKLDRDRKHDRIVIEKPFGHDLESAETLNAKVKSAFSEEQTFRIDHYLGKETVQNILAFRFANALFEPIWDRKYIDHVQITVSEDVGVEKRGGFYETAGALRDMIQNHLLQVMCMVAMEPPTSFDANEIRDKKVDVLHAIRPIPQGEVYKYAVRGQYGAGYHMGQPVPGYRQEVGVDPNSSTETFVALKLYVDNWRWQGVPFYLRTGKRLPAKTSQVSIQFNPVPHLAFPSSASDHWEPNRLTLNIQPKEGIVMRMQAKQPGKGMRLQTVNMEFCYADNFNVEPPEAYETLLYDVILGDGTLFMRADQERAAWTVLMPILEAWASTPSIDFPNYAAGTWGPESAEALIARDGRSWAFIPPEGIQG